MLHVQAAPPAFTAHAPKFNADAEPLRLDAPGSGRRIRLRLAALWPWRELWLACLTCLRGIPRLA